MPPKWSWVVAPVEDWTALLGDLDRLNALWAKIQEGRDFAVQPILLTAGGQVWLSMTVKVTPDGYLVKMSAQRAGRAEVYSEDTAIQRAALLGAPAQTRETLISQMISVHARALVGTAQRPAPPNGGTLN